MSGPMRRSLLLLVLMSACGDDDPDMDPAASEHCIAIRAQYIQRKQSLDYNAGLTANSAQILRQSYTQLELFRSQNFECFK